MQFNIEQLNIGKADNSTFNTQHSTLNIAVGFNSQSQALAENNSTFNIQNSTLP